METAGIDDFGDGWFFGPLDAWTEDLAQANLNDFGRRFFRSLVVRDLARRLRVLDVLRRHPEISDVPIPPVIHITGLERSGTTMLHNVLARHRTARALLRWELMEPVPPPDAGPSGDDPRIAAVQASVDKMRGSTLERMHWVNADEPEECVWGFIDAVSMLGQAPSFCMPAWRRFLLEEDQTRSYEHYRRVIQILLWKRPLPPDGFLVLKAPQIAVHIAAFAEVFPEAHFVVADRDPFRCVSSITTMGHSIIEPFCVDNPLTGDGLRRRLSLSWQSPKFPAMSEFTTARPDRITHVPYPVLVADPIAAAHEVFGAAGVSSDADLDSAIGAFLESQRSGGRAAPPAELPTMGYTDDAVRSHPDVAAYCERFDVRPETERLTGAHP